jgi:DMSO/TMAO reductase YedYZ molybdopterin-dependent catalytic subunit
MSFISRGFRGRRAEDAAPGRVPPGQYVTRDFPVLSAGPTPRVDLAEWRLDIDGAVGAPR